ncbi:prolyl aminopeptidase [Actinokineospora fastidiosa]|uniref:Proline iminopeptidase n=1 Tax=Actinokineospora fastidiosa TaxID=1816 RepID=A0A918LFU7_9PSEU|nr:prolyl aminopeptidase [Actinokineospora fastidiosa]GGS41601.1 proline iminopeptidase [Actinokineospora fastidiosa]
MLLELHPPIEPHDSGMLDVGDGNHIYWEAVGNPDGKPLVYLHGGPGSGCSINQRRWFDPQKYRAILFDQRNCGRSTPNAVDPAVDLSTNTTQNLIADIEKLREHLGVDRWLVSGASWGSTLALAYAQAHPQRVTEMVIIAVTVTRRSDTDWLYRGVRRFFPGEWRRFHSVVSHVPEDAPIEDILNAYGALTADPDQAVREHAAAEWLRWEDTVISLEPHGTPGAYSNRFDQRQVCFVRICAHYFGNGAFLDEGVLLREAGRLAGIPAVLIHGRHDLGGPLEVAWDLAQAWPDARLEVIEDAGHTGSPAARDAFLRAYRDFA